MSCSGCRRVRSPDNGTIKAAAAVAAWHSKKRESKQVAVSCTWARYRDQTAGRQTGHRGNPQGKSAEGQAGHSGGMINVEQINLWLDAHLQNQYWRVAIIIGSGGWLIVPSCCGILVLPLLFRLSRKTVPTSTTGSSNPVAGGSADGDPGGQSTSRRWISSRSRISMPVIPASPPP